MNDDLRRNIIMLAIEGHADVEIAARAGVNRAYVQHVRAAEGIPPNEEPST